MNRVRTGLYLCTLLALSTIMLGEFGCSKKQLASGSENQSMSAKETAVSETIQPDRIVSIPPPAFSRGETPASGGEPPSQNTQSTKPSSSTPSTNSLSPITTSTLNDKDSVKNPGALGVGDIYFDFDKYTVRPDAQSVLERNGQWMQSESGKSVLIEGHCDERGTLAYNLVLGEKRAKSAKRYLENLGIPASRLQTTSYGEVKPACREHNEGCWKYNRRAHFTVQ
jgi:peptidoglycan-associated lipoprotein